jgi:hypothetical protein
MTKEEILTTDTLTRKGTLKVLTAKDGDLTFEWDPANESEVNVARKAFADAKDKGYFAYRTELVDGEPEHAQLKEFDPDATRITMTPQLVGG